MKKRRSNKRLVVFGFIALLIGLGGYAYYTQSAQAAQAPAAPVLQTAKVRTGDIRITATGAGTLTPAAELDLGFRTSGTLVELSLKVGDTVQANTVIARLDDTAARLQVAQAELNLQGAQAKYDDLKAGATTAIDPNRLTAASIAVKQATDALAEAQVNYNAVFDAARDWELTDPKLADKLLAARDAAAKALSKAQDTLTVARSQYSVTASGLTDVIDADQSTVAQAALTLEQAKLSLDSARLTLSNTVLVAPMSGTVTAIKADVGEAVGTSPIVTLADLGQSLLRVVVEENDANKATVNNPISAVFDAAPDTAFKGTLLRVDPLLVSVDGSPAVQAWATLDTADSEITLISGMSAEVEIIAGEAKNALLVPAQALRELAPGSFAVFIVGANEQLTLTPVTVGLRDFANVQILSGLKAGDVVSTGTVETK
ncbi:MAG: efflux RND transporter periplasmic adaptor subunit [Thermoflexales bacterium]|nr:efflux RND transporter periplasmic adaptor subunit [Thermoflexales bacterium]